MLQQIIKEAHKAQMPINAADTAVVLASQAQLQPEVEVTWCHAAQQQHPQRD